MQVNTLHYQHWVAILHPGNQLNESKTMKFETINSSKIIWTIYPANEWDDSTAEYCADGDGLVTVKAKKCGCFVLFNEIEYLASFKTLAEALEAGQNWLANDYPEIFAKACI